MLLLNVKKVKIGSSEFDVEYTDDVNLLAGDNLGYITHTAGKIYVKKSQVPWMQSRNLWHEIFHSISYLHQVLENDTHANIELNEREINRLAIAMNNIEFEYLDPDSGQKRERNPFLE